VATADKQYQRLPGAGTRRQGLVSAWSTRSRLYLGKDHLLCVDSQLTSEDYKRFYYRDIQAIIVRFSNRRNIWNAVFGGLAALAAIITLVGLSVPEMVTVFIALGFVGLFGIFLLINTACGPTCVTHVRTAVQIEELPSLNRLRRTRTVMNRLRPLIVEAQGQLTSEEIQTKAAEAGPAVASASVPASPFISPIAALKHYHGRAHLILFWLLLADVPSTLITVFFKSGWTEAFAILLLLGTAAAAIVALVKQHDSNMPANLKSIPWIGLASLALFFITSVVYGIVLAIKQGTSIPELSPLKDAVTLALTIVSTTISLGTGSLGLFWLRKFRSANPRPPPITVAPPGELSDKT
jgi:hypothetical protein